MTTTFFLLRHAAHDNVGGFLAGRMPGIRLGADGRAQADRLARRMAREAFKAVLTSPRERTRETAEAVAAACGGKSVEIDENLDEIDFGGWSGKTFEELNLDPSWREWNAERGRASTPAGETMQGVEQRVSACLEAAAQKFPNAAVALVSHADIIKTAACLALGLPPEAGARFEISPASITTIIRGDWGAKVWQLNETVDR